MPAPTGPSDHPVANAEMLGEFLASAFAHKGLWPLLWYSDEPPNGDLGGHGQSEAIERIDVEATLSALWAKLDPDPTATAPFDSYPGLLNSTGGTAEAAKIVGERLGAAAWAAAPRTVSLSVTNPPATPEDALRIAAECYPFCPCPRPTRPARCNASLARSRTSIAGGSSGSTSVRDERGGSPSETLMRQAQPRSLGSGTRSVSWKRSRHPAQ